MVKGRGNRTQVPSRRKRVTRDPLWEMQPGESMIAYDAFRHYRDLGPSRTLRRSAEMVGKTEGHLSDWSSKWLWVERVRAYDARMDTIFQAEVERSIREGAQNWIQRQHDIREQEWVMAMALREKVIEMLKHPVQRIVRTSRMKRGGKTIVNTTIVEPADWAWSSLPGLLKAVSERARLASEMPTEGARFPTREVTGESLSDVDAFLHDIGADDEPQVPDPVAVEGGQQ